MSEIVFLKIVQGMVKGHNNNGTYLRTIGQPGAISAIIQGDMIAITYKDGSVKLYNQNGTYVKTL